MRNIGTEAAMMVTAASALAQITSVTPSSVAGRVSRNSGVARLALPHACGSRHECQLTWEIPPSELRERRALDERRRGSAVKID